MSWATSEQALEILAQDFPDACQRRAIGSCIGAVIDGTVAIAAGWVTAASVNVIIHSAQQEQPLTARVMFGGLAVLGAYTVVDRAKLAAQEVSKAKQHFEQRKRAGQSKTTYFIGESYFRRQLLKEEESQAVEIKPHPCLSTIPEGELGAVNGIMLSGFQYAPGLVRTAYKCLSPMDGSTRMLFLPEAFRMNRKIALLIGPAFVVAENRGGDLYSKAIGPALDLGSYYKKKRKHLPAHQRSDLAWIPAVAEQ